MNLGSLFAGRLFVPEGPKIDIKTVSLQIVIMQSAFYLSNSLVLGLLSTLLGFQWTTPEQIFSPYAFEFNFYGGIAVINLAFQLCLMTLTLMLVVERAVKVLDFVGTMFFFHFLLCWIHTGFPGL